MGLHWAPLVALLVKRLLQLHARVLCAPAPLPGRPAQPVQRLLEALAQTPGSLDFQPFRAGRQAWARLLLDRLVLETLLEHRRD
jgi:hypothetical protein